MKKIIVIALLIVFCSACLRLCAMYSVLLMDNSYFTPEESSWVAFRYTMAGDGSGDGWIYGEDGRYYYRIGSDGECDSILKSRNVAHRAVESCDKFYWKLEKGSEPEGFDKLNYHTWGEKIGYNWGKGLRFMDLLLCPKVAIF